MKVIVTKNAEKQLKKLDRDIFTRVLNGLKGLEEIPPQGDIKSLKGYRGMYRLRVGKYRILYEILDEKIYILNIGSRGDIYK